MTISLDRREKTKSDSEFQERIGNQGNPLPLLTGGEPESFQKMIIDIVIKTGGVVITALLITGVIALTTRQIVYTAAPLIVENVTIEAVESLRP